MAVYSKNNRGYYKYESLWIISDSSYEDIIDILKVIPKTKHTIEALKSL